MKTMHVVLLVIVFFFACKKRNEEIVHPLPSALHIKVVEVTDSNQLTHAINKEKYAYDADGRLLVLESSGVANFRSQFEYTNGKWIKLITENTGTEGAFLPNYELSLELTRNETGQIVNLKTKGNILVTETRFVYDANGNLIQSEELSNDLPFRIIHYSHFVNGRWTQSYYEQYFYGENSTRIRESNTCYRSLDDYDREAIRIVKRNFDRIDTLDGVITPVFQKSDSTTHLFTYFELSDIEKQLLKEKEAEITKYYSLNLDTYQFLRDYMHPAGSFSYKSSREIRTDSQPPLNRDCQVNERNFYGLPSKISINTNNGNPLYRTILYDIE